MTEGKEWKFFGFPPGDQAKNPIAEAYVDRIGVMTGDLPARTIHYFQISWGLKIDGSRLVSGDFGNDPYLIGRIVRADLELLIDISNRGHTLARDLRASADGFWWPIKRLWRVMRRHRTTPLE